MVGVVSWAIVIRVLGIYVSVVVKISGILSSICNLGRGVRVETIGMRKFGVWFALFVNMSIVMNRSVVKRMHWRRKRRHV